MQSIALAIDLGGTNIKAGLVDCNGNLLGDCLVNTGADLRAEVVADRIAQVIFDLSQKAKERNFRPLGVGIGVPGAVYEDRATVSQAPNFPQWRDAPIKSLMEQRIDLPVLLDNDANLAALGESWTGAGRDAKSMILFTLGTGIGGGIILDGKIWRGAWGMAGEIGHITIEPDGPACGCGNAGCLEALAAKNAVIKNAALLVTQGKAPILKELVKGDIDAVVPEIIFQAAKSGCQASQGVFEKMGKDIGIACASLLNVLCVEKFVLGGGMCGAYEFFIESLKSEIQRRAYRIPAERVRVEKARLGNTAGLLGAGKMIMDLL